MTELSPSTQVVLDAFASVPINSRSGSRLALAAVLRAVADHLKHEFPLSPECTEWDSGHDAGIQKVANKIIAIAAELDTL